MHARSDTTWWGEGKSYFAQKEIRGDTPADYTEEVERRLWAGIQETNKKIFTERNGVSIFLALTDDECHEVVRTSHDRFRTPLEHDVILPQAMKDAGVPYTPSWDRPADGEPSTNAHQDSSDITLNACLSTTSLAGGELTFSADTPEAAAVESEAGLKF